MLLDTVHDRDDVAAVISVARGAGTVVDNVPAPESWKVSLARVERHTTRAVEACAAVRDPAYLLISSLVSHALHSFVARRVVACRHREDIAAETTCILPRDLCVRYHPAFNRDSIMSLPVTIMTLKLRI